MSDANYRIRYKKGDFEVEVQGDKTWVETKFEQLRIDKTTELVSPLSAQATVPTTVDTTLPPSLVEFINAKGNPSEHTDLELLFAYWLLKKENMTFYNVSDIENCYNEARIPKPRNINDVQNKLQKKGYITLVKEQKEGKKAWVITLTGEKYVQEMKA
ncbi:MAG: hypothetical protein QW445_01680 [Candidatus Bathyarchaeia archaeon]